MRSDDPAPAPTWDATRELCEAIRGKAPMSAPTTSGTEIDRANIQGRIVLVDPRSQA